MRYTLRMESFDDVSRKNRPTHPEALADHSFDAPDLSMSFTALTGPSKVHTALKSPLLIDALNREIAAAALAAQTNCPPFPTGIVTMRDWALMGRNGFPFHPRLGLGLYGMQFGAGPLDYVRWQTSSDFAASMSASDGDPTQQIMTFDARDPAALPVREAWTLGSPGIDIYGHWILDYVPRLFIMQHAAMQFPDTVRLITPPLPAWADYFLEAMGFPAHIVTTTDPGAPVTAAILRAPTFPKIGYAFDYGLCSAAWRWFAHRARGSDQAAPSEGNPKIWLSRKRWPVRRELANEAEVEAHVAGRGYAIIHPQELSLPKQAKLFANARVIVGLDGSALHNVVLSRPGAALGVIGRADRRNLWHLNICEALGHSVGFLECDSANAAPLDVLDRLLDALEKAARPR